MIPFLTWLLRILAPVASTLVLEIKTTQALDPTSVKAGDIAVTGAVAGAHLALKLMTDVVSQPEAPPHYHAVHWTLTPI